MSETQMKSLVESATIFVQDQYYGGKVVSNAIKNTKLYKYRFAKALRDIFALVSSIPATV